MKPPVPYFGSKQRVADWIVSLFPTHGHYVEPYAGGLSVLLAKWPSPMETVNDLDGDLVNFWRVLRNRPVDLLRACELTPHSRAELAESWEPTEDEVERARRVWVRLSQGRGGMMRRSGWRHYTTASGSSFSMPDHLGAYRDRLLASAERISSVSLECLPALTVIGKYGAASDVLLYVDPPYLGTTRSHRDRYGAEMRGEGDHRELASALADCQAAVILSGYRSPLYDELYAGWHTYEQTTTTGNAAGDRARVEVVWSNRPLGSQASLFEVGAS